MGDQSKSSGKHHDVFVLSGGAARGAVQVGMMEGLLEHGIVPDALVGTSVGALNAAFLGWRNDRARIQELRARWLRLSTQDIFPGGTMTRMGHLLRRRPYLFSPAALSRLLADWIPTERLEDLPTPVRIVTTPLAGNSAVYHRHGDVHQLLLASAAVPAVFPPVLLPASCGFPGLHVDGGVSDLVPISGAADLVPTRVFVLDASVPARAPRGRTPIDVLVASLGVATRVRPVPDLGPGGRGAPDDDAGPRCLDDRLLLHGATPRPRPRRRGGPPGSAGPGTDPHRSTPPQHHPVVGPPTRLLTPRAS